MRQPVHIIAAVAANGVIGRGGLLPWHLPEDLRHYVSTTRGGALILGRRSFEDTGRPLPDRTTIVVSRNSHYAPAGCLRAASFPEALALARSLGVPVFVCGGAAIYAEALPLADTLVVTRVGAVFEGDTFFPPFEAAFPHVVSRRDVVDSGTPLAFEVRWRRS